MTTQTDTDPFAGAEKHPAVSWKGKPVGTRLVAKVVAAPATVRARDFDTREVKSWPDGQPAWTVVTEVEIGGVVHGLWADKPSALYAALGAAQSAAGQRIAPGGTLTVEFTGEVPNAKKPHLNPQKQFRAHYAPPDAFTATGPVDDEPPF